MALASPLSDAQSIFEPPRCFEPLSSRLAVFWAGWTTVGWVLLTGMAAVVGAHIVDQFARRMPAPRAIPAATSASARDGASASASSWAHVATSIVGTAVRAAAPLAIVISSYLLAATYESPQIVQSNALPYSFAAPALAGGGYCYPPAHCDAYDGVYKPPWWRNPTTVIGTTADVRVLSAYYAYLALLAIIGPLMRLSAALESYCSTPLRVRLPTLGRAHYVDTSCGEMLTVLFLWSLLLYAFYDALDIQTLALLDTPAALQRLGAACGSLLNLLVGLVLLPVGRALVVVGVPHERAVSYHRTIGTSIIAVGALHVAVEHAHWLIKRTWLAFTFNYVHTHTGQDVWPWAVPMMNLLFVALLVASLAALSPIRRRYYNVFLAMHVVVMPCFLLGASLHTPATAHAHDCVHDSHATVMYTHVTAHAHDSHARDWHAPPPSLPQARWYTRGAPGSSPLPASPSISLTSSLAQSAPLRRPSRRRRVWWGSASSRVALWHSHYAPKRAHPRLGLPYGCASEPSLGCNPTRSQFQRREATARRRRWQAQAASPTAPPLLSVRRAMRALVTWTRRRHTRGRYTSRPPATIAGPTGC